MMNRNSKRQLTEEEQYQRAKVEVMIGLTIFIVSILGMVVTKVYFSM